MSQFTPPQVPDFSLLSTKDLRDKLSSYGISAIGRTKKDTLVNMLRSHYIRTILPAIVPKCDGYLNFDGINYRFYSSSRIGFKFRCTKYLHPNSTWTYRKAVKAAYDNMEGENQQFINCCGILFIGHNGNGILSYPQLIPPYHRCGCLNTISTLNLGYHDERPPLEMISPTCRFVDVNTPERRQSTIAELSSARVKWSGLTGGNFRGESHRKFVLDISEQPSVEVLVKQVMAPLIDIVKQRYPALVNIKYGALMSMPRCPSQYQGHDNRLHSDYQQLYSNITPNQRPISIILALDDFNFIYLPSLTAAREEMISLQVPPGHGLIFTNNCLHSGGENDSNNIKYRLFAYMASDPAHIPHNNVTIYNWSSDDNKATIRLVNETGVEE